MILIAIRPHPVVGVHGVCVVEGEAEALAQADEGLLAVRLDAQRLAHARNRLLTFIYISS
jgi:hypothetical protein